MVAPNVLNRKLSMEHTLLMQLCEPVIHKIMDTENRSALIIPSSNAVGRYMPHNLRLTSYLYTLES